MADVRSLLRNELASRIPDTTRAGKKRKLEATQAEIRKRPKPAEDQEETVEQADTTEEPHLPEQPAPLSQTTPPIAADEDEAEAGGAQPPTSGASTSEPTPGTIDEDEWAAFEREVVAPTKALSPPASGVMKSSATISAAPVSAAELARREEEERESRSKDREARLQGEQEEATRSLEEEFDEMEQLDERVKRLKQRREELLKLREETLDTDNIVAAKEASTGGAGKSKIRNESKAEDEENEEDDLDDLDDDEWDNWRFR